MYQEVCYLNVSSDFIKDIKIDPRNKWRKVDSLGLDRSSTDNAIED